MCNTACIIFGASSLKPEEIKGRRVLEIGSKNVNGGLRDIIENWDPAEYMGIDIESGGGA